MKLSNIFNDIKNLKPIDNFSWFLFLKIVEFEEENLDYF